MTNYQTFWRKVTEDGHKRCEMADHYCFRCGGTGNGKGPLNQCSLCNGTGHIRCHYVKDAHHFFPKRRIKMQLRGAELEAALTDVRNGVCLCRTHHDFVEGGQMRCPKPQLLVLFLADHRLRPHASGVTEVSNSLAEPERKEDGPATGSKRGDPDRA